VPRPQPPPNTDIRASRDPLFAKTSAIGPGGPVTMRADDRAYNVYSRPIDSPDGVPRCGAAGIGSPWGCCTSMRSLRHRVKGFFVVLAILSGMLSLLLPRGQPAQAAKLVRSTLPLAIRVVVRWMVIIAILLAIGFVTKYSWTSRGAWCSPGRWRHPRY